jgi:glycosyltransferase involved in cell wall biosynthesis
MLPRISIIIPCYNAVSTIARTIDSLITQNYQNLELILIDGDSKDRTMEIVDRYQEYFQVIISEPDSGQANALNKGFKLATGDIWGWLCADDELTPGALLHVAQLFQLHPDIDLVTAGCERVFPDRTQFLTKPRPDVMTRMGYHNGIEQPSTFWRSTLHHQAGELDESYNYAFDWDWWNRLKLCGARVLTDKYILSRYHFSDDNKTSTGSRALVDEMHRVMQKYDSSDGRLADIYLWLYTDFDLAGFYDKPQHVGRIGWIYHLLTKDRHPYKVIYWLLSVKVLSIRYGRDSIEGYNWNFASRQERGLCWYRQDEIAVENPIVNDAMATINLTPLTSSPAFNSPSVSEEILPALVNPIGCRPRLAIDCLYFQIANTGMGRVWTALLQEWQKSGFIEHLVLIDRSGTAPKISGASYHTTSSFDFQQPAKESFKLQQICDRYQIDLFLSTYYSIPIGTPTAVLIHDMIPEIFHTDLAVMPLAEKYLSILHADRYMAVSQSTARDLQKYYPHLAESDITVALNGVDRRFAPQSTERIQQFKTEYKINKPYFLVVGNRYANGNYKNVAHFFRAVAEYPDRHRYVIVCVGGSDFLEPELAALVDPAFVYLLSLNDADLVAAYAGATALVYPSRYEGFGLPILEAMACGCPVITCANSALTEVAGEAAIYVSDTDTSDLAMALDKVQQPTVREYLIAQGLERARLFSWEKTAATIADLLLARCQESTTTGKPSISPLWSELRALQSVQSEIQGQQAVEIRELKSELIAAHQTIDSMKTTKFWKMRERWFDFKRAIGLVDRF